MIPTPYYYEETTMGTIQKDVFSKLLSDRIIMLFDQINEDTACIVIAQMLALEAEDPNKDIYLYINSPGGSVRAGFAIYDTMRHVKCDVSTLCIGEAASMGALILAAGTKGKRYSLENSSIMIHQALGGVQFGQAADVRIQAENIMSVKKQLDSLLARATGKSVEEIERDTDRDNYMTPEEAVKYGIIDRVIIDE